MNETKVENEVFLPYAGNKQSCADGKDLWPCVGRYSLAQTVM